MFLTTKALVLREVKYRDKDKMLTLLTENEGKISVRARGALGKSCKYRASTEQLCFSDVTLFGNKGRWSLNEAEVIEQFIGLREDFSRLALGAYIGELLEAVADEDSPGTALLRLGLNSLYALSRGIYSPEHIKPVFEMRLMCLSGYEPDLSACGECGQENISKPVLDIFGGGLCCREHFSGQEPEGVSLCRDSLEALRYIAASDERRIFSFELPEEPAARLYNAGQEYVLAQLGRGFKTLDYFNKYTKA